MSKRTRTKGKGIPDSGLESEAPQYQQEPPKERPTLFQKERVEWPDEPLSSEIDDETEDREETPQPSQPPQAPLPTLDSVSVLVAQMAQMQVMQLQQATEDKKEQAARNDQMMLILRAQTEAMQAANAFQKAEAERVKVLERELRRHREEMTAREVARDKTASANRVPEMEKLANAENMHGFLAAFAKQMKRCAVPKETWIAHLVLILDDKSRNFQANMPEE